MIDTSGFALPKPSHRKVRSDKGEAKRNPPSRGRLPAWKLYHDATSPDSERWATVTASAWQWVRRVLCRMANERCECCSRGAFLGQGHAHHLHGRGMGSSKRDDRILIRAHDGTVDRNLAWLCGWCHSDIHNGRLHWPDNL